MEQTHLWNANINSTYADEFVKQLFTYKTCEVMGVDENYYEDITFVADFDRFNRGETVAHARMNFGNSTITITPDSNDDIIKSTEPVTYVMRMSLIKTD
jgi:uncharacterized glyoxalase superfamily protein PhnB